MATYLEKLERIAATMSDRTGLKNIIPGSISGQLAQAVAFEQMNLETELEADSAKNSLLLATGKDLDKLGYDFFGIKRRLAVRTNVTSSMKLLQFYVASGTFGDINNNIDIIVPQGTVLEGKLGATIIRLRIPEEVILPNTASQVFIGGELIQGTNDPLPSRTINKHHFFGYAKSLNESLLVTNTTVIATGRPEESDENYRYRLVKSLSAFTRTNTDGLLETVNSVSGVSYSFVDQSSNGGGTFTIYVQGMSPITSDELLLDIEFAINSQLGAWVTYNIAKMNYVGLQLSLNIVTSNPSCYIGNSAFIANVQDTISSYVNNFIGPEFYINSILKKIADSNSDITSVTFDYVNVFTGVDNTREYYAINFIDSPIPVLFLENTEKMIIEPLQNQILVQVS